MSEPTYSLVFDRERASELFKEVGAREIVLAGMAPELDWEGCLVYWGDPPEDHEGQFCVGITGPAADTVQQRLVEGLEKQGIDVLQIYEGAPEPRETIATASGGRWTSPST